MGLWWKKVDKGELILPEKQQVVCFEGDRTAMPKSIPILWRYNQDWHSLQVRLTGGVPDDGYYVFFESKGMAMHYRWLMYTPFVMVRVGPVPVKFWVTDRNGQPGKLYDTGVVVLRSSSRGLIINTNEYRSQLFYTERETSGHTRI